VSIFARVCLSPCALPPSISSLRACQGSFDMVVTLFSSSTTPVLLFPSGPSSLRFLSLFQALPFRTLSLFPPPHEVFVTFSSFQTHPHLLPFSHCSANTSEYLAQTARAPFFFHLRLRSFGNSLRPIRARHSPPRLGLFRHSCVACRNLRPPPNTPPFLREAVPTVIASSVLPQ